MSGRVLQPGNLFLAPVWLQPAQSTAWFQSGISYSIPKKLCPKRPRPAPGAGATGLEEEMTNQGRGIGGRKARKELRSGCSAKPGGKGTDLPVLVLLELSRRLQPSNKKISLSKRRNMKNRICFFVCVWVWFFLKKSILVVYEDSSSALGKRSLLFQAPCSAQECPGSRPAGLEVP